MKRKIFVPVLVFMAIGCYSSVSAYSFNGHEYELTSGNLTWHEAEAEAVAWGGHLVTINNQVEMDWLANTFPIAEYGEIFIGINDLDIEGIFVWSSGEVSAYTNWREGEPNNWEYPDGTTENVGTMNWSEAGKWNDVNETFAYQFGGVMERSPSGPAPVPEPATMLLFGTGLVGLVGFRMRRKK